MTDFVVLDSQIPSDIGETKLWTKALNSRSFCLMDLFERFANYCKLHNVLFWLDQSALWIGSSLKHIEDNINVCMMEKDYHALIQELTKEEEKDEGHHAFKCLLEYSEEQDVVFALELKGHISESDFRIILHSFIVDSENSKILVSKFPVSQKRSSSPTSLRKICFNQDEIMPVQDVLVLGKLVKGSANCIQQKKEGDGKSMEEGARSTTNELYCCPPFRSIPSHPNSVLLNDAFRTADEPFILHNSKEFCFSQEDLTQVFLRQKDTWGYRTDTAIGVCECDFLPSTTLFQQWEENQLKLNLVDTECDDSSLFPEYFKLVSDFRSYFVLSPSKVWTEFHEDSGDKGGGWMYLKVGKKVWHCISPVDMKYLKENGYDYDQTNHLSITELLHILDCYLWGKIYVGVIGENDFLYFPPWWAHSVYTEEKSFGIGGYFNIENI
jgi:hypothetical protein